ncbi:signal recognition particle subunit SRP19/SEC65 family protein [Thermoplasma acidophilum]|uniref:signal recognition particle subunit SRP19/SEC65 family protein n=1 Tax=Thermoplasma acidophilum TaxID=2303 RepID=UPI00001660B1|nr:signal recognition particle subunit SRP19/SEC65 family protein [Thermoplasma acidophilum]MCY0851772.1 signal recognition particle [Thermoplasma acidophilum]
MRCALYLQYFSRDIPRSKGRRLSKRSLANFSEERLRKILDEAGITYEVRECYYPRIPWQKTKMYILESNLKKSSIMKLIEKRL